VYPGTRLGLEAYGLELGLETYGLEVGHGLETYGIELETYGLELGLETYGLQLGLDDFRISELELGLRLVMLVLRYYYYYTVSNNKIFQNNFRTPYMSTKSVNVVEAYLRN